MPQLLRETGTVRISEASEDGLVDLLIISPGEGSSGTYSPEVLQQAATERIFPAGTHTFLDHPGISEERDRPERSIRDLAGSLTTDAEWRESPEPGLYAQARIYPSWRPVLAEMADDIGLSIRAFGTADADGNITRLTRAESVDYVTRAGRGGRILSLLEAARGTAVPLAEARNAGQWIESRLHLAFTEIADRLAMDGHLTREERIGLSGAISDALTAFNVRLADDLPQLYQRDPYDYPPDPTDDRPATEGAQMPEIAQEELDRLRAAKTENTTLRAANEALTTENGTLRTEALRISARDHAATALAESQLPDPARQRVIEQVTATDIPTRSDGTLDEAALTSAVTEASTREAAYLASVGGAGTPRGGSNGSGSDPTAQPGNEGDGKRLTEADIDREVAAAFGRQIKES